MRFHLFKSPACLQETGTWAEIMAPYLAVAKAKQRRTQHARERAAAKEAKEAPAGKTIRKHSKVPKLPTTVAPHTTRPVHTLAGFVRQTQTPAPKRRTQVPPQ